MASPAILLLEDGTVFHGESAGAEFLAHGILVSSALIAGMPDLLTDPAYAGKIVCFTYPHVGTSGVVPADLQSDYVPAFGVIAKEVGSFAANRLGRDPMNVWLAKNNIPAIEGVDTRLIARIIAEKGAEKGRVKAAIGTDAFADIALLQAELAKPLDPPEAPGVTAPENWTTPENAADNAIDATKVLIYDFGAKAGFLSKLHEKACVTKRVPANHPAKDALSEQPQAIVFSSGPGAPSDYPESIAAAKALIDSANGKIPLWGIGLGAGILAAAAGAKIVSEKPHYGIHPVGRANSPIAEMTSQAHDFQIDESSLADAGLTVTYRHLNDNAVEGFACRERKITAHLFNPEGAPGPHDSLHLFDDFMKQL